MSGRHQFPGVAGAYVALMPVLVEVAREHGYALAVHGSLNTDCDLIAVPWTEEAAEALTLIKALKGAVGAGTFKLDQELDEQFWPDCAPTPKPHGRVAYSLHFTDRGSDGPYLDVSVMPRVPRHAEGLDVQIIGPEPCG